MGGNVTGGGNLYATGDNETRAWFTRQWSIWPKRADQRFTTNIAFHYGGVLAFRALHGREPEMSSDFRDHVEWHDKNAADDQPPGITG